jgi:hypothetical protein
MRKINNKYYYIYSSENSHDLCYAISNKPDGEFAYGGVLVSIGDVFLNGRSHGEALNYLGNTHGSIECVNGKWYVFYHRQTNLNQFSRQACAEPVNVLPDGSIPQVEITSCGLNGGPLAGHGEYDARIACNLRSAKGVFAYSMIKPENTDHPYFTQETPDCEDKPSQYIANMRDGSMAGFKYFAMDGTRKIWMEIRGGADGFFDVSTKINAPPQARILVIPGGEWYKTSASFLPLNGTCALYFTYHGGGSVDFKSFTLGD